MTDQVLDLIENAFSDYLIEKITGKDLCSRLVTALDAMNDSKKFTVYIEKIAKRDTQFFGMNVFPDIDDLNQLCQGIVENTTYRDILKRWRSIEKWTISIDPKVFDRNFISFNPKELTAMLLHEVGHVTISDEPIEYFYRAYREANARMRAIQHVNKKALYILYTIPLAIACMQKFWVNGKNELKLEVAADKTLIATGYAEHLVSAFDKIIKAGGTHSAKSSAEKLDIIESSVEWCNTNIVDVRKRRDKLKDELYYTAIQYNSSYINAVCSMVLERLGARLRERYTGYVAESVMPIDVMNDKTLLTKYLTEFDLKKFAAVEQSIYSGDSEYKIAMESVFNKRKNSRVMLPSQYDVDRISVEIDKIENHYDRVYVLDMIYDCLERISNYEEAIAFDETRSRKEKKTIAEMRDQLNKLREMTLAKKNVDKSYKFYVKLPDVASDYEG